MLNENQERLKKLDIWPYSALDKKREIVTLSPCEEEDIERLAEMYETFEPKAAVHGLPPIDRHTRYEWIKSALELGVNLKAEIDGRIVAQGSLFEMADSSVAEFSVFIHNLFQNRGLGTAVASVLTSSARKMGYKKIWAFEDRNNTRALNMYRKAGFRDTKGQELELDLSLIPDAIDLTMLLVDDVHPTGEVKPPNYLLNQKVNDDTRSVFVFSNQFEQFKFGENHPFLPERSRLVHELLKRNDLLDIPGTQFMEPSPIDEDSILAFHDPKYFYYLVMASSGAFIPEMLRYGLGTNDNPVVPGVLEYNKLIIGASVMGADILLKNPNVNLVFSPTGGLHHGGPDYASGFCYLNDVPIVIKYLLQNKKRVLYVDIDAHHGDGVQFAFYNDPRVLKISLHESARTLFPWNSGFENELGEGDGYGYNVNVPFAPSTEDEIYREAFKRVVKPLAAAFKADVCVSAIGVDTMYTDLLSHLSLTNNIYAEAVCEISRLAPKTLLLGAGGYNAHNIARDWALAWSALHDAEPVSDYFGQVGARLAASGEIEGVSLRDSYPFISPIKIAKARAEANRVMNYIEKTVFPIHGIQVSAAPSAAEG